jgi:hypothetical protein
MCKTARILEVLREERPRWPLSAQRRPHRKRPTTRRRATHRRDRVSRYGAARALSRVHRPERVRPHSGLRPTSKAPLGARRSPPRSAPIPRSRRSARSAPNVRAASANRELGDFQSITMGKPRQRRHGAGALDQQLRPADPGAARTYVCAAAQGSGGRTFPGESVDSTREGSTANGVVFGSSPSQHSQGG